ncbi:GFA family protein [Shewanella sp.]|uniref:GFA family protein n=1 Tax=Shewanella sp. TaxID=50422 RepID=UPI00356825EE
MTKKSLIGGCLCGAVKVEVEPPVKWVAHCHCSQCQRAHGAAFVTWFGVSQQQACIRDPENLLAWYSSSAQAKRGFCKRCGSSLFFTSSRWPGELHIARAVMESELDDLPMAHVFYDTHVSWFDVNDELPKKTAADLA